MTQGELTVAAISAEEHVAFIGQRRSASFLQTPAWAAVKSEWRAESIGWRDADGTLVGTGLVLHRPIPRLRKYTLAYLPEGPLIEWEDQDLGRWLDPMAAHLKQAGAFGIRMGAPVPTRRWTAAQVKEGLADPGIRSLREVTTELDPVGARVTDHLAAHGWREAAIKRAMPYVTGQITVFTDANTFLNKDALTYLVKHYQNPKIGAVAGEKKIMVNQSADASSAGEGFYWKYESALKKWDYELYSNVGAAGELFSIRTDLYQPVEADTIIDDHMIAMRIAEEGYIIAYEPKAYALETASADSAEELKRKIRIAAGGIQSVYRLKKAANPFNNPILTFQYFSHRLLRWVLTPWLMIVLFFLNIIIVVRYPDSSMYLIILFLQISFYLAALLGWFLESRKIKLKAAFIPFYFSMMNYAVIAGTFRYYKGAQSAAWEKSKRK